MLITKVLVMVIMMTMMVVVLMMTSMSMVTLVMVRVHMMVKVKVVPMMSTRSMLNRLAWMVLVLKLELNDMDDSVDMATEVMARMVARARGDRDGGCDGCDAQMHT
jgi:hypothetical protein